MNYRIWYSTETFADFVIKNTNLKEKNFTKKKMYESDANNPTNFHTMPDHIKKILYLDAPDLIVEIDHEPIFSVEVSTEAGTGHNAFQRFARLAASVENNVPAFYIYPEAAIITRQSSSPKWDKINPLVFKALEDVMSIYQIPALLYYFPTDFRKYPDPIESPNKNTKGMRYETDYEYAGSPLGSDTEMLLMFTAMNDIISIVEKKGVVNSRENLLGLRSIIDRKTFMQTEYIKKDGSLDWSPLTATTKMPTEYLLNYMSQYEDSGYKIGELLRSRESTIFYKVDAKFRGDPYPGALAAIDYLICREGKTFEERKYNLILCWSDIEVDTTNKTIQLLGTKGKVKDFVKVVQGSEKKNILTKTYKQIKNSEVPRYYMQVRYGSTYSKVKHVRVFSYFADAILFPDGAFWRDA